MRPKGAGDKATRYKGNKEKTSTFVPFYSVPSCQMTLFRTLLQLNIVDLSLGDIGGGDTPGPIPNPEVKPVSADGTWLETARESRSLPRGFLYPSAVYVLLHLKQHHISCGAIIFTSVYCS